MNVVGYVSVVVIAYLLGSIPVGYVMGRLYGVDVRDYGSGKTGGTNLARIVGWPKTIPVAIGDPAKAILAVLIARWVTGNEWCAVAAALAVVAGHLWPIYIGFRGGRGVGPMVGALLVFAPVVGVISMVAGFLIAVISRFVSLGSVCGAALAIILTAAAFIYGAESLPHLLFVVIGCGTIIFLHHDNIKRLLAGTERKLGERVPIKPEKQG
jgi:acyl phosphate:glycerol-3-phosphate acyltransferase